MYLIQELLNENGQGMDVGSILASEVACYLCESNDKSHISL